MALLFLMLLREWNSKGMHTSLHGCAYAYINLPVTSTLLYRGDAMSGGPEAPPATSPLYVNDSAQVSSL